MANIQIKDLNSVSSLLVTDNFEIQQVGGLSKKVSGQQLIDLTRGLITNSQIRYVSQLGSDATGDGSYNNPWGSLVNAYSQITDASAAFPYQIEVLNGVYTELGIPNVKPFIFVNFNNSQFTVAGPVSLDPSWTGVISGLIIWENTLLADFFLNWDFEAAGAVGSVVQLRKHMFGGTPITWNINGSGGSIVIIDSTFSFSNTINMAISNCYGGIGNSTTGYVSVNMSTLDGVFNVNNCEILGDFDANTHNTSNLTFRLDSSLIIGSCKINNLGSGSINFTKTNTVLNSTPQIANVGAGQLNIIYDYLNTDFTTLGTVLLQPQIPSLIWGKFETWGPNIPNTTVPSALNPVPLNLTNAEETFTFTGLGITCDNNAVFRNETSRNGWFNISCELVFGGVITVNDFAFQYNYGSTNPPTNTDLNILTFATSKLPTSGLLDKTQMVMNADIYLNANNYVQLLVSNVSGGPFDLKVYSLTMRMKAN